MSNAVTTESIHEETKDVRTEWAARHLLDLREACKRIITEVEEATFSGPLDEDGLMTSPTDQLRWEHEHDGVDHARWLLLVNYCESELERSPAVRAAIKLLDQLGVTSNEAWDVAIDPDTPGHRQFHIAVDDEWDAWKEYFNNNPLGPNKEEA
mgnify:CR=1 FL=1